MARQFFESFNQKQIDSYKEEMGVEIPDVESLRTDQSPFEVREKSESREIIGGALFSQGAIELGDDAFTNFYDLSSTAESKSVAPEIITSNHNLSLKRLLINDENTIGALNAGFFHLVDEGTYTPVDPTYNLCIREGSIVGLPASDRPAVFSSGNSFKAKDVQARGTVGIGSSEYEWVGARAGHVDDMQGNQIVLYNSACCTVRHIQSEKTGTKRVLDEQLNFTPQEIDVFDVVVLADDDGTLRIKEVVVGGHTNLFAGNFILQVRGGDAGRFQASSLVRPLTLDGIDLASIGSAVSVGPSVHHFLDKHDHEINHDLSLGERPPFEQRRMARSVIYKDTGGGIHIRMFDGAPRTQHFQGITPQETALLLPKETVQWAYHLDPGQSSRLAVKEQDGKVATFGNQHYVRWPKKQERPFLWSPSNGRRVPSAIVLRKE